MEANSPRHPRRVVHPGDIEIPTQAGIDSRFGHHLVAGAVVALFPDRAPRPAGHPCKLKPDRGWPHSWAPEPDRDGREQIHSRPPTACHRAPCQIFLHIVNTADTHAQGADGNTDMSQEHTPVTGGEFLPLPSLKPPRQSFSQRSSRLMVITQRLMAAWWWPQS